MPETNVRALAASLLVRAVTQSNSRVDSIDWSEDPLTAEEQLVKFRTEWLGEWTKEADRAAIVKEKVIEAEWVEPAELEAMLKDCKGWELFMSAMGGRLLHEIHRSPDVPYLS